MASSSAGPGDAIVPLRRASPNPATRVMSPRMHPNEGILSGLQASCQICDQMTFEPAVCAKCGTYGHPVCLGLERFCDFPFCSRCIPEVTAECASFQDSQRRVSRSSVCSSPYCVDAPGPPPVHPLRAAEAVRQLSLNDGLSTICCLWPLSAERGSYGCSTIYPSPPIVKRDVQRTRNVFHSSRFAYPHQPIQKQSPSELP